MTNDEHGLLQAIIAAPDEDTPRLIYADWLEDQGDAARAEFIRVQCELAKRIPWPALKELYLGGEVQHISEIPDSTWNQWGNVIVPLVQQLRPLVVPENAPWLNLSLPKGVVLAWDRGFVREVHTTLAQWVGGPCGACNESSVHCNGTDCMSIWACSYCSHTKCACNPPSQRFMCGCECQDCLTVRYSCASCHGTGTTPGIGPALVAAQPVVRVVVSDKWPQNWQGGWRFNLDDGIVNGTEFRKLPKELFYLGDFFWKNSDIVIYDTEQAAQDALECHALLAHARKER